MAKHTHLSKTLDIIHKHLELDAHAKNILSNKYILANIMQHTIEECRNMSIDELVASIEGTPEIQRIPLDPELLPEAIIGDNTECNIPNEGKNTYDIRFHAYIPRIEKTVKLLLNIEAQNDHTPGYNLVTRGIFYVARMISAQKNTEFTGENYDDIELNEKKRILEEEYSLPMTNEFGKELEQMGTFSDYYYGKGFDKGISQGISQGSKTTAVDNAKKLLKNGASYELVRNSIDLLTDEELQEIYDEVMGVTV